MNLTASDICLIIETCRAQGVERVIVGNAKLEVSFAKPIAETPLHTEQPKPVTTVHEIEHPIEFKDIQTDPGLSNTRDELAELLISDPVTYEEMLGRGELVNGETAHN